MPRFHTKPFASPFGTKLTLLKPYVPQNLFVMSSALIDLGGKPNRISARSTFEFS